MASGSPPEGETNIEGTANQAPPVSQRNSRLIAIARGLGFGNTARAIDARNRRMAGATGAAPAGSSVPQAPDKQTEKKSGSLTLSPSAMPPATRRGLLTQPMVRSAPPAMRRRI